MHLLYRLCIFIFLALPGNVAAYIPCESICGTHTIDEPVIEELIASQAFRRLHYINQYGCNHYTVSTYDYTRYSHSIGVFMLLRLNGAPLKEQIAGLLHDISHTVFSHVGDHLFHNSNYQDDIHTWYLYISGVQTILNKYGYTAEDMNIKSGNFPLLEQSLPDLCADRIEYIIHGGYLEGMFDMQTMQKIVKHLHVNEGRWYFDSQKYAAIFANTSLYLTEYVFGSLANMASYDWCAKALRRALDINELTFNDIHFSTDDLVWHALTKSTDPIIEKYMTCVQNYTKHSMLSTQKDGDIHFSPKFRGVNPWVETEYGMMRLTEIDPTFRKKYSDLQTYLTKGYYVQYMYPNY